MGFQSAAASTPSASGTALRLQSGLQMLAEALQLADQLEIEPWQFAVEIQSLEQVGVTRADCRWLVGKGLLQFAEETSMAGAALRTFQPRGGLKFSDATCFVLNSHAASAASDARPKPRWNPNRHELRYGDQLIKRFRVPAPNQEAILEAFEEEGWPARVDDPLPPKSGQNPKRRVHDTINALNRKHHHPLIRFFGDGTGQGICWERLDED